MDFNANKYLWTNHAQMKMKFYGLSEGRVRRVLHSPARTEEGVAPNTFAAMQPGSYKIKDGKKVWNQEIWVMYQIKNGKSKTENLKPKIGSKQTKVISAWRYPGMSKDRGGLPIEILNEMQEALDCE